MPTLRLLPCSFGKKTNVLFLSKMVYFSCALYYDSFPKIRFFLNCNISPCLQYSNISQYIESLPLYHDTYRIARFLPITALNSRGGTIAVYFLNLLYNSTFLTIVSQFSNSSFCVHVAVNVYFISQQLKFYIIMSS